MTSIGWPFVEVVAQLLDRDEREVVLGDFVETGENAAKALLDVLGLVFRREMGRWKNWQPWLAGFGLALPGSFLLMGMSVSVSLGYQHLRGPRIFEGFSCSRARLFFCSHGRGAVALWWEHYRDALSGQALLCASLHASFALRGSAYRLCRDSAWCSFCCQQLWESARVCGVSGSGRVWPCLWRSPSRP